MKKTQLYFFCYRHLTAAQQYFGLQKSSICHGQGQLHRGCLAWKFETQPTPLSRIYKLHIIYKQMKVPQVFVDDPDLTTLAGGRILPHVYQQKPTQLCLYLPGTSEWLPSMKIADTIVPWAILWLFYFEDWLLSDDWKGGGVHRDINNKNHMRQCHKNVINSTI